MATITSVANGGWNETATWDTATIPTAEDTVHIEHTVTLDGNATAQEIIIGDGSITTDGNPLTSRCTLTVGTMSLERMLSDSRTIRTDGMTLAIGSASITCRGSDTFPYTADITETQNTVVIDDPGILGFTAQMQDIKPEGIARAWARKVSNGVRYMTLLVKIRVSEGHIIGTLYRMAEGPFQVLAVTHSAIIKGYIEGIVPVDSVGKEFATFRITIAEGQ